MKKYTLIIIISIVVLSGCSYSNIHTLQNIGMLFETSIDDNPWSEKGYEALLEMEDEFRTNIFYEENVVAESDVQLAVDDFVQEGVNLIIGHGNFYGSYFEELSESFPEVHFIYTNGDIYNDSVTSLNFNSHAMGFFGGMAAGEMTRSNHVGVIAAYSWQPELEGFYEGVKFRQPEAEIIVSFVNDWNNKAQAKEIYERLRESGVDVIYPAGNGFSEEVIKAASADGVFSIGYIADQFETAPEHVLTSTVQHIDEVYIETVKEFNKGNLIGEIRTYDFQDGMISLGTFNETIPAHFQTELKQEVEKYKETNLLPNETAIQ